MAHTRLAYSAEGIGGHEQCADLSGFLAWCPLAYKGRFISLPGVEGHLGDWL